MAQESELEEIEQVAAQQRMTVAEWVRQALRQVRSGVSTTPVEQKLLVVREAAALSYPSGDVEQLNAAIERGYLDGRS